MSQGLSLLCNRVTRFECARIEKFRLDILYWILLFRYISKIPNPPIIITKIKCICDTHIGEIDHAFCFFYLPETAKK